MKLNFNHVYRGFLFLMLVLLTTSATVAQTSVSGTITDGENGDPLIGASILVTGTSTGTVTDFDGNFTLNVPADAETLTVSYTGYATQTIPLDGQTTIDIQLTSGELLDEVVVVGYGSVTQKEVTSAVTSIDSEDFNAGNINDPSQLIQGKVAGLTISRVGGNANGGSVIRLRGLSSFGGNQSPLIIIDGVVGANLNTVDPADIESINVLKDGSAAAIYGIQASAGVILITTKRGSAGDAQLNYRGYVTAESVAKRPDIAGRDLYLELVRETGELTGVDNVDNFVNGVDYGGETDWIDEVTRTGISHVHNLSYSGGTGGMTYRASVNYRDIQGIGVSNDGFRQLNGRLSVNQSTLNDKLNLSVDVTATDRDADNFNPNAFRYAITYNPTAPSRVDNPGFNVNETVVANGINAYGGYFEIDNFDYFNPLSIAQQVLSERQQTNLLYNLRATYNVLDDLSVTASYSRNREDGVNAGFASRFSRFAGNASPTATRLGNASRSVNDNRNDLFEVTATYNTDLGDNGLELLAGYSWQEYQFQGFNAGGSGLPSDAFGFSNLGSLTDIAAGQIGVGSYKGNYRVIGFFGRARLGIGTAYNITASVRRDGTSRNGPTNKWDLFPAISASADLVDALNITAADQLKVRVGYGVTGSLPNGNYGYLQTFSTGAQFPLNGAYIPTIGPNSNPNENLRFEKKGEFNVGADFAFADYRLTGSVDYYIRQTSDLITNVLVPSPPFLFPNVEANLNNVDLVNTGVELVLGYGFGDVGGTGFSYEPRLTFSTFSTKLNDNGENPDFNFGAGGVQEFESSSPGSPGQNLDPLSRIVIGEDFGGIYTRRLDVEATLASGEYVFLGDGEADKVLVGNGLPDFSASLSNTFRYGPVDLNIFLRGDFGHDLVNMPRNFYGQQGNLATRTIENVIVNDLFLRGVTTAPRVSDYFVEDASFVALDNAQLGYTFNLGEGSGFNDLRVYVAGQNLFYITDYTGVDPNVRFFDDQNSNGIIDNGENALTPGLDRRSTFFRTRSFTFGVNVGF